MCTKIHARTESQRTGGALLFSSSPDDGGVCATVDESSGGGALDCGCISGSVNEVVDVEGCCATTKAVSGAGTVGSLRHIVGVRW